MQRQQTLVIRHGSPVLDRSWTVEQLDLEDLVLAYMGRATVGDRLGRPLVGVPS